MSTIYEALELLRLDHDWGYKELAWVMARSGFKLSERAVYYLLTDEASRGKTTKRTQHKIQKFLEYASGRKLKGKPRARAPRKGAR